MALPLTHSLPPSVSLTRKVADWFAREIRAGRLASGERLPTEQALIGRFGVSRTVIREAMSALRSEGLVVSRQGSGVFVADQLASSAFRIDSEEVRSLKEMQDILQLRLAVEVEAAGLAAAMRRSDDLTRIKRCIDMIDRSIDDGGTGVEADFAFHQAVGSATQNPYFERFIHFLGPIIIPPRFIRPEAETPEQRRRYLRTVQEEHRSLYEAIRRSDVDGARSSLRAHLEAGRERYRRMFRGR